MGSVSEEVRRHYDAYYGDARLAAWRRIGAVDKAANVRELCASLGARSLLDVGCGDGALLARLADLGFATERVGLDISASAIAAARAGGVAARFETFAGDTLPFERKSFDLAILSHVVEHLEHPRVLLHETRRVARHVFVEVPCEHTLRLPRDYAPDPVGHINFYTPTTIRTLLQTCGFTVERQIVRGSSLEALRFERPLGGALQWAVREAALAVAPRLAAAIFCYHSALLAH